MIGAAVGATVCVGVSSGGCLAIAVPAAPAVVAAAGASVVHGSAMLAKVANGPQHAKTTDAHHAWPKYLGGSKDQPLYEMDRGIHQKYHAELDRAVRGRWEGGIDFRKLAPVTQADYLRELREFSSAFDKANGTETLRYLEQAILEAGYK